MLWTRILRPLWDRWRHGADGAEWAKRTAPQGPR